jgi:hypothetical protein
VPKVRARIDAGDNQVDRLFEIAKCGESNTIRWGAVARECLRTICETDFLDAQRTIQSFDVPASRPIPVWREDGDFSQLSHFVRESEQAGRKYTVVICYKNMFCHSYLPLFKNLRRF